MWCAREHLYYVEFLTVDGLYFMGFGQKYVNGRLRFPMPTDLEPAGNKSFRIDFIGGPYEFVGLTDAQILYAKEKYSAAIFMVPWNQALPSVSAASAYRDFRATISR